MVAATNKVFGKIPGTDHPSMDGKLYLQEGFDVLASGLAHGGWKSVVPNTVPGQKNRTYGHTPYMYKNAQRDGPMATYLVEAAARKNFGLWTHTSVKRLIRTGGHITAVEVEPYAQGGYTGIVNLTAVTGRVILSAGAFGSTKILFRSESRMPLVEIFLTRIGGIGPKDQLEIVAASTDGPTMINRTQWINLPVGQNLDDHTNVSFPILIRQNSH
jgi:cellobiose dehydrogenase (acceptor)